MKKKLLSALLSAVMVMMPLGVSCRRKRDHQPGCGRARPERSGSMPDRGFLRQTAVCPSGKQAHVSRVDDEDDGAAAHL